MNPDTGAVVPERTLVSLLERAQTPEVRAMVAQNLDAAFPWRSVPRDRIEAAYIAEHHGQARAGRKHMERDLARGALIPEVITRLRGTVVESARG